MKPKSPFGWAILAVFLAHVVGFYIAYLNDDAPQMIWCVVVGAGWGVLTRNSWPERSQP